MYLQPSWSRSSFFVHLLVWKQSQSQGGFLGGFCSSPGNLLKASSWRQLHWPPGARGSFHRPPPAPWSYAWSNAETPLTVGWAEQWEDWGVQGRKCSGPFFWNNCQVLVWCVWPWWASLGSVYGHFALCFWKATSPHLLIISALDSWLTTLFSLFVLLS